MSPSKIFQERSNLIWHTLLMYPEIPVDGLNEIISQIKPGITFVAVEPMATTYLPRLFNVTLSDETTCVLSIPPIFGVRLLRQERKLMLAQVALNVFLNNTQLVSSNIVPSTSNSIIPNPLTKPNYAPRLSALPQIVPNLLKYSSEGKDLTVPYILSAPIGGTPLSSVALYLTIPEQRTINQQLGTLSHTLALITSPNREFGLAADVLSSLVPTSLPATDSSTASGVHGSSTWSHAFAVLLESAMRDAEDMLVNLPYHEIRRYIRTYSHYFDEIKVPRLLILNIRDPDNVMVVREDFSGGAEGDSGAKVVGLRDWSQGIFEDAIGFLDSWRDVSMEDDDTEEGTEMAASDDREVSEKFRALMYICYRAVVTIATEYQRPRADSMKRDDAGRIRLTSALRELRALESVLDAELS